MNVNDTFSYVLGPNYIEDDCVNRFHAILARNTRYNPPNTIYELLVPDLRSQMRPISPSQEHLQLLYRENNDTDIMFADVGHWVCIHHINGQLRVYDSLYSNLTEMQSRCIATLFPHAPQVVFPEVQRQPNFQDCGVFAIAFATSIALGEDPCGKVYCTHTMRQHLFNMLHSELLLSFPLANVLPVGTALTDPRFECTSDVTSSFVKSSGKRGRPKNKYIGSKLDRKRNDERERKRRQKINRSLCIAQDELPETDEIILQAIFPSSESISVESVTHTGSNNMASLSPSYFPRDLNDCLTITKPCKVMSQETCVLLARGRPKKKFLFSKVERKRNSEREKKRRQKINRSLRIRQDGQLHCAKICSKPVSSTECISFKSITYTHFNNVTDLQPSHPYALCNILNNTLTLRHTSHLSRVSQRRFDNEYFTVGSLKQSKYVEGNNDKRKRQSGENLEKVKNKKRKRNKIIISSGHAISSSMRKRAKNLTMSKKHAMPRKNPEVQNIGQQCDTFGQGAVSQDPEVRMVKQEREMSSHNIAQREAEREFEAITSGNNEFSRIWSTVSDSFFAAILDGRTITCTCCGRLWQKTSIKTLSKDAIKRKKILSDEYLKNIYYLSTSDSGHFCSTCHKNILLGAIPRLALCNGLMFPDIPAVLSELTPLEERLVSPRHVFLKIVRKGQGLGFQHGLMGNVVNVPVDIDSMVSALPRHIKDNNIITVELKRKLCYKHGRKEVIRPEKVRAAARYLVQTELFRQVGITYNESWSHVDIEDDSDATCTCDMEHQEEIPLNPGNNETLLDKEQDIVITMAPGEGKVPICLLDDQNLEELAFIKIHGGQKRNLKVKLNHSDILKSEITSFDRRAMRVDYLFTALKKQQMGRLRGNISTCLRKKISGGVPILAENMLDDNFIQNLIQHDEGYKILKGVRNSPAHWEAEKKKVLGMVRQFGVPCLFITLSAAETRWPELIRQLKKTVDNEDVTLCEANDLPYETKARLIQCDPYICATFFEHRLRQLRKTWDSPAGPFGEYVIEHFYYRIEFQHRGSPHAHMMLWLQNAPLFKPGDCTSVHEITHFVDKIISCCSDEIPESLSQLQQHKHTHTCRPKPNRPCRFNIPFFPMDETRLLLELQPDNNLTTKWKEIGVTLMNQLHDIPPEVKSFDEYLAFINLPLDHYILAIRGTLKRPKIFHKRLPKDVFLNPFSKKILNLQQSNMDIQYILDPYACSVYIVDYINKTDRGMSNLLRGAVEEAKQGNKTIKEALRSVCNAFMNSSEISAQEAVYCLAGLPMSMGSESEIFINTGHPEQRVHILKRHQQLQNLDPLSTDIFERNLIDHYICRPKDDTFNSMCLAFFSAFYMYKKNAKSFSKDQDRDVENESYSIHTDEDVSEGKWIKLLNNDGYIRRRKKPRVIRYRGYNKEQDPENYYREQLMLYIPWRDENAELLNGDSNIKDKYDKFIDTIKEQSCQFNKLGINEEYEELLHAVKNAEIHNEREIDTVGTCNGNGGPLEGFEYETQKNDAEDIFNLERKKCYTEVNNENTFGIIAQPAVFSSDELLHVTRILNDDQRQFLLHVGHYFAHQTSSTPPIYLFVSGGAGVGKSLLIKTLYQYLMIKHFNKVPGCNPDDVKILLCAYTGKAAFGIGGQTVHCALGLPVSQCGHTMPELSASVANTLACRLASVKLIVLDEISMLGSRTFHQINRRLQQIFHSKEPFAGISIIAVGDFRQLPPVGDNWIFQPNTTNNPMALLAGAPLWEPFLLFQMDKVMRQRDDMNFVTALNNMASGKMTPEDIALIQSRCFKAELPRDAYGAIHLFSTNREVDQYNEEMLNSMQEESAIVLAIDCVTGSPNENAKQKALETIASLSTMKTYGLPKVLTLKVEARYMYTVNIDTTDGLVNGTTGRLKAIEFGKHVKSGERRPLRLWFLFDDKNTGKSMRNKFSSLNRTHTKNLQSNWTPLESATYIIKRWKSNMTVRRTQFPIVAAEGITIHKSQGATMDKVVVHLTRNVRRAMLYVACSRATSASGLFIANEQGKFNPPTPPSDTNPVTKEMQRLTSTCLLIPKYRFLQYLPADTIQVIFHNVQSFYKHTLDINSDPIVNSSHIALFVETWSSKTDENIFLQGFHEMARINGPLNNEVNRGWGSILFVRSDVVLTVPSAKCRCYCYDGPGGGHCECIDVEVSGVHIISIYRSPKCSVDTTVECLDTILNASTSKYTFPVIVVGDFNINFNKCQSNVLYTYLQSKGLFPKISEPTTVDFTSIDNIFSNMDNLQVGVIETFFSHHKQLWMRFVSQ